MKRVKSNQKVKNAIVWHKKLSARILKEGQTKWLVRTMDKCLLRLKKHGIRGL